MKRAKYISNGTITYKIIGEQGPQGPAGPKGPGGPKGNDGKSAYQIAVDNGYVGTESEWLETLKGADDKGYTVPDLLSNGVDDETQTLIDYFNGKSNGVYKIPYGTKYDRDILENNIASGVVLIDMSVINGCVSGEYREKLMIVKSKDHSNDDLVAGVESGYHPSIVVNNTGSSGGESADMFRSTFWHGYGYASNNAIKFNFGTQAYKKDDKWIYGIIAHRSAKDDSIIDSTILNLDENGSVAVNGSPKAGYDFVVNASSRGVNPNITKSKVNNDTQGGEAIQELGTRDSTNNNVSSLVRLYGSDGFTKFENNGKSACKHKNGQFFIDGFESMDWISVSGSLPSVTRGRYFVVNNSSPITMTGVNGLPNNCVITLLFANDNTTLDHTKFKLKGNVNYTPSQYSSITLVKNSALSSSLIEINRTEM